MWSIELEFVVGNSLTKIRPGTHVSCLGQFTQNLRGLHTRMETTIISLWLFDCLFKTLHRKQSIRKKRIGMPSTSSDNEAQRRCTQGNLSAYQVRATHPEGQHNREVNVTLLWLPPFKNMNEAPPLSFKIEVRRRVPII